MWLCRSGGEEELIRPWLGNMQGEVKVFSTYGAPKAPVPTVVYQAASCSVFSFSGTRKKQSLEGTFWKSL